MCGGGFNGSSCRSRRRRVGPGISRRTVAAAIEDEAINDNDSGGGGGLWQREGGEVHQRPSPRVRGGVEWSRDEEDDKLDLYRRRYGPFDLYLNLIQRSKK